MITYLVDFALLITHYLSSIIVPTISWKEKVLSTILMWRVSEPNLLKNNNKCLLIVIDLNPLKKCASYFFVRLSGLLNYLPKNGCLLKNTKGGLYSLLIYFRSDRISNICTSYIYSTILLKKGHCFRKFGLCYDRFLNHKLRVCWEIFCLADFCYPYKSTIQQLVL